MLNQLLTYKRMKQFTEYLFDKRTKSPRWRSSSKRSWLLPEGNTEKLAPRRCQRRN